MVAFIFRLFKLYNWSFNELLNVNLEEMPFSGSDRDLFGVHRLQPGIAWSMWEKFLLCILPLQVGVNNKELAVL